MPQGEEATPSAVNVENQPVAPIVDDETAELPVVQTAVPNQKKSGRLAFLLVVLGLVVFGAVFWVYKEPIVGFFVKQPTATTTPSPVKPPSAEDKELATFITPKTGETWLASTKQMAPQGWLKIEQLSHYQNITGSVPGSGITPQQQLDDNKPTYLEVGARAGNTIVLVYSQEDSLAATWYLFEKSPDGSVVLVIQPQAAGGVDENQQSAVTDKVKRVDRTIHYDSLNVPTKISLGNAESVLRPQYLSFAAEGLSKQTTTNGVKTTVVKKLGGSTLYKTETNYADTKLTNIGYFIETPFKTKIGMVYEPNQLSLEKYHFDNNAAVQFTASDGSVTYDMLRPIARGCGGASASVTRSEVLKQTDLIAVGKTSTGRSVYEPKDKQGSLYTKAYQEYKNSYNTEIVSFDEYLKNHGLVVIENAAGELLVYTREHYTPVTGCAKPVIYLYPQQDATVSVKVGASVTVSDPLYPTRGWIVQARPDGTLTYQGKSYESLFWEGTGNGEYPALVAGTVVERSRAAATIRQQLAQQGLNQKEINDFMAFWENKIPSQPYVRLTWLTTSELNTLAPLQITPKPDTVIRVFLDMDGYDQPISLPTQQLVAPPARNGFTVVEWGGLTSEARH